MLKSTVYTIGTALLRAHENDVPVDVLVDGHWLHGAVSAVDGRGVVLMCEDGGLAMIRLERVSVALVRQAEAFDVHTDESGEAHPMPAAAADRTDEPRVVRPRPSIEATGLHRDELVVRIEDGAQPGD
ncbi:hypothetical protein [Nocardioides sp. B-3]|uniref:hypothetical protein n=1 Tax=Nocardioides sp. B-3 TaxID=2895565 RepID=UPI0021524C2D|nr:hypothetical protein [Nocardioides sp. B-3]UUZ60177.1 hypothetical protein LP418_04335 [Nocardioides sp. B-3]